MQQAGIWWQGNELQAFGPWEWRHLFFPSSWECWNVDVWGEGWKAWIPSASPQRFAVKLSFILGCWFWNTESKRWRVHISLRDSISDSLKTYSTTVSAYAHSSEAGVSLPLYEMKPLPLPPPRCEGRRRVGGAAEECVGPCCCPGMRSVMPPLIDELGRLRWRAGTAFCLGSCCILARNSIYLFLKVHDW